MTITAHGRIHGNRIELDSDLGIPDGAEVEVTVVITTPKEKEPWGEGIKRSAGVAANIPEFDQAFEQIARDREAASFRETDS